MGGPITFYPVATCDTAMGLITPALAFVPTALGNNGNAATQFVPDRVVRSVITRGCDLLRSVVCRYHEACYHYAPYADILNIASLYVPSLPALLVHMTASTLSMGIRPDTQIGFNPAKWESYLDNAGRIDIGDISSDNAGEGYEFEFMGYVYLAEGRVEDALRVFNRAAQTLLAEAGRIQHHTIVFNDDGSVSAHSLGARVQASHYATDAARIYHEMLLLNGVDRQDTECEMERALVTAISLRSGLDSTFRHRPEGATSMLEGDRLQSERRYREAADAYLKAAHTFSRSEDSELAGDALFLRGLMKERADLPAFGSQTNWFRTLAVEYGRQGRRSVACERPDMAALYFRQQALMSARVGDIAAALSARTDEADAIAKYGDSQVSRGRYDFSKHTFSLLATLLAALRKDTRATIIKLADIHGSSAETEPRNYPVLKAYDYHCRAALLEKSGLFVEAAEAYSNAARFYSLSSNYNAALTTSHSSALLYIRVGDYNKAIEQFKREARFFELWKRGQYASSEYRHHSESIDAILCSYKRLIRQYDTLDEAGKLRLLNEIEGTLSQFRLDGDRDLEHVEREVRVILSL